MRKILLILALLILPAFILGRQLGIFFESGDRVELLEKRTQTSKTFKNPDGTYILEESAGPIHYQDKEGKWQEINTTIKQTLDQEYEFKNETNIFDSYFKKEIDAKEAVKLQVGESSIAYTFEDNELGKLNKVEGYPKDNLFVYPNAYPGVDIRYSISSTCLLEEFVLSQYQPLEKISQKVHFGNVDFQKQEDGSIKIFDLNGNLLWIIPRPLMYEEENPKERSFGIHFEITQQGKDYLITKVIDQEGKDWLSDPARKYPVVIDLSSTISASWGAETNQFGDIYPCDGEDWVGLYYSQRYRTAEKFSLSSLPSNANVTKVELEVRVKGAGPSGHRVSIYPYGTNGQDDPQSDSATTMWGKCDDGSPYITNNDLMTSTGWKTRTLGSSESSAASQHVENAIDSPDRYSVCLIESGENHNYGTLYEYCSSSKPRLIVTYEEIPTVNPPSVTTNSATSIGETTATLNGNITNAGGENCDQRGFDWGLTASYGSSWAQSGSFGTGAFSHGISGLSSGTTYYFRAKAHNSAGWGYGSPLTFTTGTPSPPTVDIKANGSDGPITIPYNTSATLSWTSTNATSCTASGDWSGAKATSGSESTGNLTSSKTYTLTCTGPGGSANDSVTVNVGAPPSPTVDIKANGSDGPITIPYNTSATLSWTSTNATSCTASGDWSGAKATSGSESTGNLTSSKTYTLTCTGPGGSANDSVTVNVGAPPYVPDKTMCDDSSGSGGGVVSASTISSPGTAAARSERLWVVTGYSGVDFPSYSELKTMYDYDNATTIASLSQIASSGTYKVLGEFEIKAGQPYPCDLGVSALIFVDGDLTIERSFTATDVSGDPLGSKNNCGSSLVFIVHGDADTSDGDIDITDGDVNNIYGIFYAVGSAPNGIISTGTSGNPLYVFGSLIARSFALGRNLGADNATYPAEQVIFMPKYFITLKDVLGRSQYSWKEVKSP